MESTPKQGLKGLIENWQSDLIAGVSVALIALPLSLGIALAAEAPPMAGIFSAIIGGVITTLYRGGHVSVNGPAKGVIGVILLGLTIMDDGSGNAFNYVLAAVVVSGALQALLGILKLGRFADIFHTSVIHGILAAIGIIIVAKQIHVALGTHSDAPGIIQNLIDALVMLPEANPFVVVISLAGLLLILFHSRISNRIFHILPTPIWVVALSVAFVYGFNFFEEHTMTFLSRDYQVGPKLLLDIPDNIMDSVMHPDFSKIGTIEFWTTTISMLIITSIESLAIAKAVDKIDPHKRKTDLNKDLTGIGIATMVSGMIGGLPIIAVIIRSTVNIHNGAKTKWSNMYQGLLLLLFIVVLSPVMTQVPLCAFAILLVYTGFKLASPAVFKQTYSLGIEQLLFFVGTMVLTLFTNLLVGLLGGLVLALVTHMFLAQLSVKDFFRLIFKSRTKLIPHEDGRYDLKVRGVANFLSILKVNKLLARVPAGASVNIDLSKTRLVGITYMDYLFEFEKTQGDTGGSVTISGLESHVSSSTHERALKINLSGSTVRLSPRQKQLRNLAIEQDFHFARQGDLNTNSLQHFHFFEIRPIDRKTNSLRGEFKELDLAWEVADVTFNEGQAFTADVHQTTLMILQLNKPIPVFTMEKERALEKIFDRLMAFTGYKDIDFDMYPGFSKKFLLMGNNEEEIRAFFTKEVIHFFESHPIYHIESNGEAIVIFDKIKLARPEEINMLILYTEALAKLLDAKQS